MVVPYNLNQPCGVGAHHGVRGVCGRVTSIFSTMFITTQARSTLCVQASKKCQPTSSSKQHGGSGNGRKGFVVEKSMPSYYSRGRGASVM